MQGHYVMPFTDGIALAASLTAEKPNDCFDMETEILTKEGWIHSKDITYDTLIANWEESKVGLHSITYSVPSDVIRRDHEGDMIVVNTDRLDIKVTPNHILIVYNETFNEYVTMEAKDLKEYVSLNPECYIPSNGYDITGGDKLPVDFSKLLLTNDKSSGILHQSYDKQTIVNIVTNQRLSGSSSLIIEKEGEKGTIYQTLIGKAPLNKKGFKLFVDAISVATVNEPVWCVTVPTHRIMVKRNNSIYAAGNCHCLPITNKVLTEKRGWVTFDNLQTGESIAQWDNNEISFVVPDEIIIGDNTEDLYRFKNKVGFSMTTTGNHRVVLKNYRNGKYKDMLAKDLFKIGGEYSIPTTGMYTPSTPLELTDDLVKLIVATQADGSFSGKTSINYRFSKQRKIDRLTTILDSLGYEYTKGSLDAYGCINFIIRSDLALAVRKYLTSTKEFSNELINLSPKQAQIFINEIQYWDGTLNANSNIILDTHGKESRDILHTICHLNGVLCTAHEYVKPNPFKPGTFRTVYRACVSNLFFSKENFSPVRTKSLEKTRVPYTGKVACVSIKSTYFLCKEDDTIFVTGNSLNAIRLWGTTDKRTEAKSFSYACFPTDITEVLTLDGWKFKKDLKTTDIVYSYNTETDNIEVDVVRGIVEFDDKPIILISNGIDQYESTEDHRWYGLKHKDDLEYSFFITADITPDTIILNSRDGDIIVESTGYKVINVLPPRPTFCITTNNSTFLMRQHGKYVSITGNCMYGVIALLV